MVAGGTLQSSSSVVGGFPQQGGVSPFRRAPLHPHPVVPPLYKPHDASCIHVSEYRKWSQRFLSHRLIAKLNSRHLVVLIGHSVSTPLAD